MLVDPILRGMFKRGGNVIVGDTVTGATNHANAGLLEGTDSDPGWVPFRLRQFYSDALGDSSTVAAPTHSVLYGRPQEGATWPDEDSGVFGTEYVRRPNANYQLLSEYGASAYPTDGSNGGGAFATGGIPYTVVPFWYESGGAGGYSRGAFALARRFVASGSWGTVDAGRWRYYPNLRGTPLRWDGGCNDSSSSISNHVRVYPTGPMPPLWPPAVTTGTATGARTISTASADYPWLEGDTFYISVMFQFEDGSYSLPFTPRPINATLTGGLGFVTAGAATQAVGSKYGYKTLEYSNIPIGPPGTIARVLLRTPKQNRVATTDALTIDISDLRILGVLQNNTQTSYSDTLSDDDGLIDDSDIVRWDLICPPRARYYGTGDQRVIAGYTLANQTAIILTAVGTTASDYALNTEDTGVQPGTESALYRVTTTGLELISASAAAALATVTIDWATYDTVQKVVDKVNATTRDATHAIWKAQLAPGVDPSAPSSGLCPTVWTVANCTAADTILTTVTSDGFANIPVGYKCYASAGVTAGTYTTYVSSSTAASNLVYLSATSTAANVTVTFYADCGDEAAVTTAGSKGWIRVYGPSYYGIVAFRRAALAGYNRPNKDRIYFTISSPGAAATGVSIAANAWGASNRRDGENSPGPVMGIVDVEGAAVICYRNRIGLFINQRGSNTGEDFDYRIIGVNNSQGCVSPWSVVRANGCAVYLTNVGLKATDKSRRELLLSGDHYQPVRGLGDMAYEVGQCIAAAASDSYDCWMGGALWGSRLVYSYRVAADSFAYAVYDFSPGVDSLGLEAVADPDTRQSYGWSTSCYMDYGNLLYGPRAMGAVQTSSGLAFYGALNDNDGTNDGRVDQMFTGNNDNGATIVGEAYGKQYLADPGARFSAQNVEATYRVPYSGVEVYFSRLPSGTLVTDTLTVASSGSSAVSRERMELTQACRSPGAAAQLVWFDDATTSGGLVHRLDLAVDVLRKLGG